MSNAKHNEYETPAELARQYFHPSFAKEIRMAVRQFVYPGHHTLRMASISLEHDAECFERHGATMCAYLTTHEVRSEGDFAMVSVRDRTPGEGWLVQATLVGWRDKHGMFGET